MYFKEPVRMFSSALKNSFTCKRDNKLTRQVVFGILFELSMGILAVFDKGWQGCSVALPIWSPTISEIPKRLSNEPRQQERNLDAGGVVSLCTAAGKAGPSTGMGRWWSGMR